MNRNLNPLLILLISLCWVVPSPAQNFTNWFDEIHFTSSAIKGLEENESVELKTVRRIDYSESVNYSDQRVMDMSGFRK